MAIDMGCKADSIVGVATDLMNFITTGATPAPAAREVADAERIAACGTALSISETADLVLAPQFTPAVEPAATSAEAMSEPTLTTETQADVTSLTTVEPAAATIEATAEDAPQACAAPIAPAAEAVPAETALGADTPAATIPVEPVIENSASAVASVDTAQPATGDVEVAGDEATPVATPPVELAPVDATPAAVATAEPTPVASAADPASDVVEATRVPAAVATPPVAESQQEARVGEAVAATEPTPVAEAGVVEQETAVPAEATAGEVGTHKLDAEPMPAAMAANGAGATEAASIAAPAS